MKAKTISMVIILLIVDTLIYYIDLHTHSFKISTRLNFLLYLTEYGETPLSAWPEVRGTADGAYSPSRSILLVLTHDCIITQLYGPTGGDGHGWLNDADAGLHTNLDAV